MLKAALNSSDNEQCCSACRSDERTLPDIDTLRQKPTREALSGAHEGRLCPVASDPPEGRFESCAPLAIGAASLVAHPTSAGNCCGEESADDCRDSACTNAGP